MTYTRAQAIERLRITRKLNTAMLLPLGIPLGTFLQLCLVSNARYEEIIDELLDAATE